MTSSPVLSGDPHKPGRYEIRVKGHLTARWAAWFDGLTLTHASDGITVIEGPVEDQAALHGLLRKVRDIGLPLVSVMHVGPDQPATPSLPPDQRPSNPRRSP